MKKIFYAILTLTLLSTPFFVLAQQTVTPPANGNVTPTAPTPINVKINNPFKGGDDLASVVDTILKDVVMPLSAVLVVLAIIYSGFKFVTAQGNPAKITEAKTGLLYVLIGAAVLLGAVGISEAIKGTLKPLLNI